MKEGQFEMIKGWWDSAKLTAPLKAMLPETTFIATLAGTPYLAVSLFLTNSSVAWVDNFIGNPSVDKKLRASLTPKFLDYISTFSKQLGKSRLFCMSMNRATNKYYERMGFTPTVKVQAYIKEIK